MADKLIIANGVRDAVEPTRLLDHWEHVHAPLVLRHRKPTRYALTKVRGKGTRFSGIGTATYADRVPDGPLPPEIQADPFYEMIDERVVLTTTEHVIVDGPAENHGLKLTVFVRRRPGTSADAFFEHWLDVHGPNMGRHLEATDGGLRYVINFDHGADDDAEFHGVAEVWYRDSEAAKVHTSSLTDDGFGEHASAREMLYIAGNEIVLSA